MQVEALLILILIGAVAGFLAVIVKGYGFGVVGNILIVGNRGCCFWGLATPAAWPFHGRRSHRSRSSRLRYGAVVLLILIGFVRRMA